MTYTEFVKRRDTYLGNNEKKMALDIAELLDHPVAQITFQEFRWVGPTEARTKLFNSLCAIFVKAGLEPPALEEVLWKSLLPVVHDENMRREVCRNAEQEKADVLRLLQCLTDQSLKTTVDKIEALANILTLFPGCAEGCPNGCISKDTVIATINSIFVEELSMPPYRPNYSLISTNCIDTVGLSSKKKVLIVDDSPAELLNTAHALVGIPNLAIKLFHYDYGGGVRKVFGPMAEGLLEQASNDILAQDPDMGLMDEGLGAIEGSELVPVLIQNAKKKIVFIANTDGLSESLVSAGCLPNFKKGRRPEGMLEALRSLK